MQVWHQRRRHSQDDTNGEHYEFGEARRHARDCGMTRVSQAWRSVRAACRQAVRFGTVAGRVGVFMVLVWVSGLTSLWSPTADADELAADGIPLQARPADELPIQQLPTPTFDRGSDPVAPTAAPTPTPPLIPTPIPPPTLPPAPAAAPPPPLASPAIDATATPIGDPCWGDEQITYVPETPRVNNELIIAVTSGRPHPYGRVAGTERTTFIKERPGQLGTVWEWSVALTWPGRHKYTFYVDSTVPCKEIEIVVRQSVATKTPTPYSDNNSGDDGDNQDGDNN
jgi:hypothetical protein